MEQMVTELRRIRRSRQKQAVIFAGLVATLVAILGTVVAMRLTL